MRKRPGGFTMVEMLGIVLLGMLVLGAWLCLPNISPARKQARLTSCGHNVGNLVKCCQLYSDVLTNLGQFPLFNESHDTNGHEAMAKLYDAYVRDHRVWSCPSKSTKTEVLKRYTEPDERSLQTGYTNYGYDPGHTPLHATVGVVADRGILNTARHKNSTNHGKDGPGQNVAVGSGSVEWWDAADARATKDVNEVPISDDIFADDIQLPGFPEDFETNLIQ